MAAKSIYAQVAPSFLALGYSPLARFPNNKWPTEWSKYCDVPPSADEMRRWGAVPGAGIALACGYNGLVAIDADSDDPAVLAVVLAALPHCRIARFGSKGFALLTRYAGDGECRFKAIMTGEGKDKRPLIEIKGLGQNITVPPSIHAKTGKQYIWFDPESGTAFMERPALSDLPSLSDEDIAGLRAACAPWASKPRLIEPIVLEPGDDAQDSPTNEEDRIVAYGRGAIEKAVSGLASLKDGRPSALFREACSTGWTVKHGVVSKQEFLSKFENACKSNGLMGRDGRHAINATLLSALHWSENDPKPILKPLSKKKNKPNGKANGHSSSSNVIDLHSGKEVKASEVSKRGFDALGFAVDEDGRRYKNRANFKNGCDIEKITIQYDEFAHEHQIIGFEGYGPRLDDAAINALWFLFWEKYSIKFGKDDWRIIVQVVGLEKRVNPAIDYLNKCEENWDGTPRLDEWTSTYLGTKNDSLCSFFGKTLLIAAVRRIRSPGCKFDYMIVFEGPEGIRKSSALAALCPNQDWFTDNFSLQWDAKQIIELTAGKMIVEIGELAGMKKSEVEHVKQTISRQFDEARLSFGRVATRRPRGFVFCGTTNEESYLISQTGNRRIWPMKLGSIRIDDIIRDRDQLWGEAAARERRGESIHALPAGIADCLRDAQREREISDPWDGKIADWLRDEQKRRDGDIELRDQTFKVTLVTIWKDALDMREAGRITMADYQRMAKCMRRVGWSKDTHSGADNWWVGPERVLKDGEDPVF